MPEDLTSTCHVTTVHSADDTRIFEKQCRSLAAAGHRVFLVAPCGNDQIREGVSVKALPKYRNRLLRATVGQMRALVRAHSANTDIVHFHDPELIAAAILLRAFGARIVYDSHEDLAAQVFSKHYLPAYARGLASWLARTLVWLWSVTAHQIIAATPAIAKNFPRAFTIVVQNFPSKPAVSLSPSARTFGQFCFVGGISNDRGIVKVLDALLDTDPETTRFVLAGRFTFEREQTEAFAHPAWQRVDYRGHVDRREADEILKYSVAGVLTYLPSPNHIESQPNKLFEYMGAGLPVIASNFDHWRGIISKHRCGVLVDPLDPRSIHAAMEWLLLNPEEARAMGQRGREAVLDSLNWQATFPLLQAAYRFAAP